MDSTKEQVVKAEEEQKTAEEQVVKAEEEQKEQEPTKITKEDPKKDPRKVDAGKLSAISRATKKRQQEIQKELNPPQETSSFDYKPILYFGIPSIFLAGMFLLSTKREAKKKPEEEKKVVVREQQPRPSTVKNISLFE